jgi:hypothetical protein
MKHTNLLLATSAMAMIGIDLAVPAVAMAQQAIPQILKPSW